MFKSIINSAFPVSGGTIGAITRLPEVQAAVETSAHGHLVLETVLVAIIGAIVGYTIKKVLDIIWPRIFKKHG